MIRLSTPFSHVATLHHFKKEIDWIKLELISGYKKHAFPLLMVWKALSFRTYLEILNHNLELHSSV